MTNTASLNQNFAASKLLEKEKAEIFIQDDTEQDDLVIKNSLTLEFKATSVLAPGATGVIVIFLKAAA